MNQDEAEKLARATRALMGIERTTLDGVRDGIMMLCNYIIAGDHKRSIENAAFERAAKVAHQYVNKPLGDERQNTQEAFDNGMNYEAGGCDNASAIEEGIRALITPAKTADTEG